MGDRRHIAVLIGSSLAWREQVMRGIASYANERGNWHVFTAPEGEEYAVFSARGYRWSGLLIRPAGAAFARKVLRLGVPVVSLGSLRTDAKIPRVKVDDRANTALALRHLLAMGLRNFAYCSMLPSLKSEDRGPAFIANVREAGYTCVSFNQAFQLSGRDTFSARTRQLISWLRQLPKPIGILAYTPDVACRIVDACYRDAIAVPEEVAVIASDDDPMKCELSQPTVTAAQIPAARIGYEAASLLDRLIDGQRAPTTPLEVPPTGNIIYRQSTAIAETRDREVHQALQLIQDAPPGEMSVSDLAERMNMSSRSLQRHFKRVVGKSPGEQLAAQRLATALRLLIETDWPASRIAAKCSFHSPSHLNRVVRAAVGLTPLQYRRRLRLGRS